MQITAVYQKRKNFAVIEVDFYKQIESHELSVEENC